MKLKASLFSKIFSHRPGKAKSVEFTLTQSRFNTIQKYALHFEESFRNPTLVRTRHHIEKYSRKMSLACQETLRYQHLKKKITVESWPADKNFLCYFLWWWKNWHYFATQFCPQFHCAWILLAGWSLLMRTHSQETIIWVALSWR